MAAAPFGVLFQIMDTINWGKVGHQFNLIEKTPSFIQKLENFELEEQLLLLENQKRESDRDFKGLVEANPNYSLEALKEEVFRDEEIEKFKKREAFIWGEILRRQNKFTPEQIAILQNAGFSFKEISEMELLVRGYNDWVLGEHDLPRYEKNFFTIRHTHDNTIKAHYRPEVEFKKIRAKQVEISQKIIGLHLDGLIDGFEERYKKSSDLEELFDREITTVKKYLKDKDFYGHITIPRRGGVSAYFDSQLGRVRMSYESRNAFYELNSIYNGDGEEASLYTKAEDEISLELSPILAVKVLNKYWDYLEKRKQNTKSTKQSAPKAKPLPQLEEIVKEGFDLLAFWRRLSGLYNPLVSESGVFIRKEGTRYHSSIFALSQALIRKEIITGYDVRTLYLILCKHFSIPPSKRPDKILKEGRFHFTDSLDDFLDII